MFPPGSLGGSWVRGVSAHSTAACSLLAVACVKCFQDTICPGLWSVGRTPGHAPCQRPEQQCSQP